MAKEKKESAINNIIAEITRENNSTIISLKEYIDALKFEYHCLTENIACYPDTVSLLERTYQEQIFEEYSSAVTTLEDYKIKAAAFEKELVEATASTKFDKLRLPQFLNVRKHYTAYVNVKKAVFKNVIKKWVPEDEKLYRAARVLLNHFSILYSQKTELDKVVYSFKRKAKAPAPTVDEIRDHSFVTAAAEKLIQQMSAFPYQDVNYMSTLANEILKAMAFITSDSVYKTDFGEQQGRCAEAYHRIRYYKYRCNSPTFPAVSAVNRLRFETAIDDEHLMIWQLIADYGGTIIQQTITKTNFISCTTYDMKEMSANMQTMVLNRAGRFSIPVFKGALNYGSEYCIVDEITDMTPIRILEPSDKSRYRVEYQTYNFSINEPVWKEGYLSKKDVIFITEDMKKGAFPINGFAYIASQYDPYETRMTTFFKMPMTETCDSYFRTEVQGLQQHNSKDVTRVVRAKKILAAQGITNPDPVQIANATRLDNNKEPLTPSRVIEAIEMMNRTNPVRLDEPISDDNDENSLRDFVEDKNCKSGEQLLIESETADTINYVLEKYLTEEERKIFLTKVLYGFNDTNDDMAFHKVSKVLHIPDCELKQKYSQIVARLQSVPELEDYKKDYISQDATSSKEKNSIRYNTQSGAMSENMINFAEVFVSDDSEMVMVSSHLFAEDIPDDSDISLDPIELSKFAN